jgi:hypothetical protein
VLPVWKVLVLNYFNILGGKLVKQDVIEWVLLFSVSCCCYEQQY